MSLESKTIRLLIVDDHELVRLGLRAAFDEHPDIDVVGEADTTDSAVAEAIRLRPDVILMDLRLPGGGGVQACREILADHPQIHILFLTSYSNQDSVLAAAFAGARGYRRALVEPPLQQGDLVGAPVECGPGFFGISPVPL